MTKCEGTCQYHLTIPAENDKDKNCNNEAVRRISGFDNDRMVVLEFCEKHYWIVNRFLELEE